jgi:hypothetical protein
MSAAQFAAWLDATAPSQAIKGSFWITPSIQSLHILAVAIVLTGALIAVLRSWRLVGVEWPLQDWARRLYPPVWWGLAALVATGVTLAVGEPTRTLTNISFQVKLALILAVLPVLYWLHRAHAAGRDATVVRRVVESLAVLLICAIIFAGRWIAYS